MNSINVKDAYEQAVKILNEASIENANLDARILLLEAMNISLEQFYLNPLKLVSRDESKLFNDYLLRRLNREPVSKIIAKKSFWKDEFIVNNFTLDPRPDSEVIIELALDYLQDRNKKYKILDLGSGSGCLILSLLREFTEASGVAVDLSPEAIEIIAKNSLNLNMTNRLRLECSNWFEKIQEKFDLIVSNPPYISKKEISKLDEEVKCFDPILALDGGEDGLDPYRYFAKELDNYLKEDGYAIFEFGDGQAKDIEEIFKNFKIIEIRKDLGKRDRAIILRGKS